MKLIRNAKLILILVFISATFCTQTSTESQSKISGGINISEAMMKAQDVDPNAMNSLKKAVNSEDPEVPTGGPIFFTQWVKYFKYQNFADAKPKHFFKNGDFKEQYKYFPGADTNATSDDGVGTTRTYIATETDFYMTVFKDNIDFMSSRQFQTRKIVDVLTFASIDPISEDPVDPWKTKDGIDEFGNFAEGFCFKVDCDKKNTAWIICSETLKEKEKLFKFLRDMKIKEQRSKGVFNLENGAPLEQKDSDDTASGFFGKKPLDTRQKSQTMNNVQDGYWITIQEWSMCNLKCGGGEEVFQRLCVPPKSGGAPCNGDSIIRRPCNTDPCQTIGAIDDPKSQNTTETLKPIVKVMAFSTRPQRYSKCVIKESDLMYENNMDVKGNNAKLSGGKGINQIPTRVIMNNRTISIYGGEDFDTQIIAMDIDKTSFIREEKNAKTYLKRCFSFVSQSSRQTATLCPFTRGDLATVEQWDYDFNLFKNQCHQSREKLEMEFKFNNRLNDKIKKAKSEVLDEREAEIKKKSGNSELNTLHDQMKQTKDVTLKAIQKELNLEDMIKKEEEERERLEDEDMLKRIDDEKKKNDCLLKAIKEKAIENQFRKRLDTEKKDIMSLQDSTRNQVGDRITILKQKIWEMRSEAKTRKQTMMQQLQDVRMSMADNLSKAYKKGDEKICSMAMVDKHNSQAYCTANFGANPNAFTMCQETIVSQRRFCKFCCQSEFGNLLEIEQNTCKKNICTKATNEGVKSSDEEKGVWVYQEAVKKDD